MLYPVGDSGCLKFPAQEALQSVNACATAEGVAFLGLVVILRRYGVEDIMDLLSDALDRPFEDKSTHGYVMNALMKIAGQNGLHNTSVQQAPLGFSATR